MFKRTAKNISVKRDVVPIAITLLLCLVLFLLPVKYGQKVFDNEERVKVKILSADNSKLISMGIIQSGEQYCEVEIQGGMFKGQTFRGMNHVNGSLEYDKIFEPGDTALAVVSHDTEGELSFVNLVDHYRLDYELILVIAFCAVLVFFAGKVGFRALLSFAFSIMAIWKVLLPAFLSGTNPVLLGAIMTVLLVSVIGGLVFGFDRRSMAAILGAAAGILVTCVTSVLLVGLFKIHGAVMPMSEQLLYSGFAHLNLTDIFIAGIFLASSGAIMDLSVDITSAVHEVVEKRPDISRLEAIKSGFNVGRNGIGTMTTTLLLAYSGGYIAQLMVFIAQGTPLVNILNLKFMSAEILHTIVGSFGLVTVAPLTAITSGMLLVASEKRRTRIKEPR